jgi:CheY-like chemotaxis protein
MNGETPEKSYRYVLVLDAIAEDCFYTCMLLQRFDCNIFTARTADEAIEYMTVAKPSAVVADAGPNGVTLLSRMTKDPRFADVSLILLSSSPDAELENRARKGEFAAYLRKPLKVEELYRVVQAVIERRPRRNLRISTHLLVRLEYEGGGREGCVTVLSEDGMFFRTLDPRPTNTIIPVTFEIKGRLIKLDAIVIYTTNFDEGPFKEPGMGMKFVKISQDDKNWIATFIIEQFEEGIVLQRGQQ